MPESKLTICFLCIYHHPGLFAFLGLYLSPQLFVHFMGRARYLYGSMQPLLPWKGLVNFNRLLEHGFPRCGLDLLRSLEEMAGKVVGHECKYINTLPVRERGKNE